MKNNLALVSLLALMAVTGRSETHGSAVRITAKQMRQITKEYDNLKDGLQQLQAEQHTIEATLKELQMHGASMNAWAANLQTREIGLDAASGISDSHLLEATKQIQETQESFNMQYVKLQQYMQEENRSFTSVSNIMKSKHDTAKNSISNVR